MICTYTYIYIYIYIERERDHTYMYVIRSRLSAACSRPNATRQIAEAIGQININGNNTIITQTIVIPSNTNKLTHDNTETHTNLCSTKKIAEVIGTRWLTTDVYETKQTIKLND